MDFARVKARARRAMVKRAEDVEQDELESGEINLIPYLDIVTNLMLFMLISVASGFILGQINTTLPDHVPADQIQPVDPAINPDERPVQLIVSTTKQGMILWSISGQEGTIAEPKARIPRLPATRANEAPRYQVQLLNDVLYEIASRRWKGKIRNLDTYEIILQCDPDIPYETVVAIMDAVRRRIPPGTKRGEKLAPVTMPKAQQQGQGPNERRVPVEAFDPDKHYLFPDILFGKWSFD